MEGKGELRLDHRRTMRSVDMQVAANDPSPMSILDTDWTEMIMTLDVGERLMSMTDLSEMLGVSIQTLYRWRHKGRARSAIGLGGMWSIAEQQLKRGWRCRRTSTNHSRDVHQDPASGGGPTKLPGLPLADLVIIHSGVHPAKAEAEVDDTFGGIAAPQDVASLWVRRTRSRSPTSWSAWRVPDSRPG
jgi:hypothetical protein